MKKIIITVENDTDGAQIWLKGDVKWEFTTANLKFGSHQFYLAFSDGTILKFEIDVYDLWRIVPAYTGKSKYSKTDGVISEQNHDSVILEGDIEWAAMSYEFEY